MLNCNNKSLITTNTKIIVDENSKSTLNSENFSKETENFDQNEEEETTEIIEIYDDKEYDETYINQDGGQETENSDNQSTLLVLPADEEYTDEFSPTEESVTQISETSADLKPNNENQDSKYKLLFPFPFSYITLKFLLM